MLEQLEEYSFWYKCIRNVLIFIFCLGLYQEFVNPFIHVWHQHMMGKGELARAESNRQIAVCEAEAKKESSKCLAEAEIIRAEGMATANKIIGNSLNENESYLRYLWIQGLNQTNSTVVYVPTEANLPILESQRLKK
jgi:hypothetical protein